MNKLTKISFTAVAGIALATGLAACTSGDESTKISPTPSKTTTPVADGAAPETGVCENGQILITQSELKADAYTLDKACDNVAVLTSNAKVTLKAPVKSISLEGSSNTIDADKIESIVVFGQGNTVKHTGSAPQVADNGQPDDTQYVAK